MRVEQSPRRRAVLRLRRKLGLAPRAVALMSCACLLSAVSIASYAATVPAMADARASRVPHIVRKSESGLGGTTGYVWARVLDSTLFATSDGGDDPASSSEVKLEDGTTIAISSIKGASALSAKSVTRLIEDAERASSQGTQGSAKGESGSQSGSSANGGSASNAGSGQNNQGGSNGSGGSGSGGSSNQGGSSSGSGSDDTRPLPSAEDEARMHAWLVAKASALNGYVGRVNNAIATYNSTGDTSACDSLANELFNIRGEFGRQTFSPKSAWYSQFSNLWGAYTHLDIYVGRYGEDQEALATFNARVAAIAL